MVSNRLSYQVCNLLSPLVSPFLRKPKKAYVMWFCGYFFIFTHTLVGFNIKDLDTREVSVDVSVAIKLVAQTHAMTTKIYQSFTLLKKPSNHNYYPIATVSSECSDSIISFLILLPYPFFI